MGLVLHFSSTKILSPQKTNITTASDETNSKLPSEETKLIEPEKVRATKDPLVAEKILAKQTRKPDSKVQRSPKVASVISNFRVVDAVLEADPVDYSGPCPVEITFRGRISAVGGSGNLSYRFLRSDGKTSPLHQLRFDLSGSKTVSTSWQLGKSGAADHQGWQSIEILEPTHLNSKQARFNINCVKQVKSVGVDKQEQEPTQHMVDHPAS